MAEVSELKRRNEELERVVREGLEREEGLRRELDSIQERLSAVEEAEERLSAVEEAEERLCREIGELEAEAVALARENLLRIEALSLELAAAQAALASTGIQLPAASSLYP